MTIICFIYKTPFITFIAAYKNINNKITHLHMFHWTFSRLLENLSLFSATTAVVKGNTCDVIVCFLHAEHFWWKKKDESFVIVCCSFILFIRRWGMNGGHFVWLLLSSPCCPLYEVFLSDCLTRGEIKKTKNNGLLCSWIGNDDQMQFGDHPSQFTSGFWRLKVHW